MNDFALTDGEKAHPLWLRLKARLTEQLIELRAHNDNPHLTEWETAALRGRIACLKSVIALGDPTFGNNPP